MTLFLKRGELRGAGQGNASHQFVGFQRLDRVLGEGKGCGIRGGAFMLSQGFPRVRSQMRPYHTKE